MKALCKRYHISHHFSDAYKPTSQGQVERRTIAVGALTLMLTSVFLLAGFVKLTDRFDAETHKKMVDSAHSYPGVFHLPVSGDTIRIAIGSAEVMCAILILFGEKIAAFASLILMSIMCGAVYYHLVTNTPFVAPAVLGTASFFLCLLSLRSSTAKRKERKLH